MKTASYETLDAFLGDRSQRFFGTGYKNTDLRIHDVTIYWGTLALTALLDIDMVGGWSARHGKARNYHLSNVEALVVAGQTVQALLYSLDGLQREEVDNLWLRGLSIVNNRAIEKCRDIPVQVVCKQFLTSTLREQQWRNATLEILIDDGALTIKNYKACYRMP